MDAFSIDNCSIFRSRYVSHTIEYQYANVSISIPLIPELSEEWSLATSMKDFAVNSDDIDTDSEEPETFDVKYLGCTIIDAVRSEEATAEAVHSVITTAKGECSRRQRRLCRYSVLFWFLPKIHHQTRDFFVVSVDVI